MDQTLSGEGHLPEPSQTLNSGKTNTVYAGFWIRFWAYLLDLLVIWSLNSLIVKPVWVLLDLPLSDGGMFSLKAVIAAIIFYSYFVLMTRFFAQTLGKMLFAIKVVPKDLNENIPWITLLFREVIGRFISKTIFLIGYIITGFTNEKQSLHDIFADTRVVHTRK
ncbi:RDD family protein [Pseudalkalibacillus sp. R45]|uniref:RDD family protein n=1 Tax=Pseudalkalibacillus sp. R45 TaxID=3457433 RepID=UPI003FCC5ADC